MDKKAIRKEIIELRDCIGVDRKKQYDELITSKVLDSSLYNKAQSIFIFIGFGSEVNTAYIIKDALEKGKEVYVPKIDNKVMKVIKIDSLDNLVPGVFGILEPKGGKELEGDCDLILMPGVAFTKDGNRIGYGGGYYDKYLSEHNGLTLRIALAYSIQVVDFIPTESYDKKVNYIVTESFVCKC